MTLWCQPQWREETHLLRLEMVFEYLEKAGLQAQENKCKFMVPSVSYLGHLIDEDGLHPCLTRCKLWSSPQAHNQYKN